MKKLFALLAVVLAVASCQKESNDLAVNMGEQETLITVALPEATRANSSESGLQSVDWSKHTLRYIFQVFDAEGNNGTAQQVVYSDDRFASFRVQLVPGREYKFAAWADVVNEDKTALHYAVDANMNVTMTGNWDVMDETRDAFYCSVVREFNGTMNSLELKRPFAKIRVLTDDMNKLMGADLKTGGVSYYTQVNTSFDVLNNTAGTPANREVTFTYDATSKYEEATNQRTLYADYLFVTDKDVVKFCLENNLTTNDFNTDIPVERNKVTTIIGSLLTNGSDIRVEVKDEFEQPESEIPAELLRVLQYGGEYTFTENLNVYKTLFIKDDTNVTLNLNGHNITIDTENDDLEYGDGIIVYGNLIINDETGKGTVTSKTRAIWARGKGSTVTINGGNYVGATNGAACEVIYASGDGKITINSGTFKAETEDQTSFAAPQYAVLNLHGNGKAGCDIVVYGGSFYKFNPADNVSENPKKDFCAEGCEVTENDDWFVVTYDPHRDYTKVSTLKELKDAVAVANSKIVFLNDITGDVEISKSVTIDGNGKTYTGAMALYTKDTHVTLKNVNFDGKGYNGYAITTSGAYYLTIEDCTAKNYGYGFVQLASATILTTVKNVTVSNMNYGVKVDYSNAVVIENADITAGVAAVLNSNYGEKPITIKNSKLNILGTWTRNNTIKTNYVFEGNNSIGKFLIDADLDNFKLAAGATLTAPNEITVTTVDGYTVKYTDGKYISK
jgi:hypothetical protein